MKGERERGEGNERVEERRGEGGGGVRVVCARLFHVRPSSTAKLKITLWGQVKRMAFSQSLPPRFPSRYTGRD